MFYVFSSFFFDITIEFIQNQFTHFAITFFEFNLHIIHNIYTFQ